MANPEDTGTFDNWITAQVPMPVGPGIDTGTFDDWITAQATWHLLYAPTAAGQTVGRGLLDSLKLGRPRLVGADG